MTSKWPSCVVIGFALAGSVEAQDIAFVSHTQQVELGQLSLPTDVDVGDDGKIYVVDSGNHQVAVFDAAGARIASLGAWGVERGQLDNPVGIGIGPEGRIYIADKGNQRIVVFDADGRLRRGIDLEEDGEKASPVDVAVSPDGRELFITTNNSHRVLVYSDGGNFLRAWGGEGDGPGQFRFPATIDVDRAANVFVVDVLNNRIQKFDPDGNVLGAFGKRGGKPGTFFRPKGVAVDTSGRIFVSDSYLGAVQVLNTDGEFLYVLGDADGTTVFETPVGLAVTGNRLLIAEMLAGRVRVLAVQL